MWEFKPSSLRMGVDVELKPSSLRMGVDVETTTDNNRKFKHSGKKQTNIKIK